MMNKIISWFIVGLIAVPSGAFAVQNNQQARRSMASQMVMSAPRVTASTNQITAMANANEAKLATTPTITPDAVRVDAESVVPPSTNNREKEKQACISNNIGVGNTFVWASRYSNTANYATMVEDVENPENNVKRYTSNYHRP